MPTDGTPWMEIDDVIIAMNDKFTLFTKFEDIVDISSASKKETGQVKLTVASPGLVSAWLAGRYQARINRQAGTGPNGEALFGMRVHTRPEDGTHYVTEIVPESSAAKAVLTDGDPSKTNAGVSSAQIFVGDEVLAIGPDGPGDATELEGKSHGAVCEEVRRHDNLRVTFKRTATSVAPATARRASMALALAVQPEIVVSAGRMPSGTFGVRVNTEDAGHVVTEVIQGSTFEQEGVRVGFILAKINGDSVVDWSHEDVCSAVQQLDEVTLAFVGGTPSSAASAPPSTLGPTVDIVLERPSVEYEFGLRVSCNNDKGVHIQHIVAGSLAAQSRLDVGQRLLKVNGADVACSYAAVLHAFRREKKVTLTVAADTNSSMKGKLRCRVVAVPRAKPDYAGFAFDVQGGICWITSVKSCRRDKLQVNDLVLAVNGISTASQTYERVLNLVAAFPDEVTLVLHRAVDEYNDDEDGSGEGGEADDGTTRVHLKRGASGNFGVDLGFDAGVLGLRVKSTEPGVEGLSDNAVILGINGEQVVGDDHTVVFAKLAMCNEVVLDVANGDVFDSMYRVVSMSQTDDVGLGIDIQSEESDQGTCIRVTNIYEGGAAHINGGVHIGDQIITINGIKLADCEHDEVVNIIDRSAWLKMILKKDGRPLLEETEFALGETVRNLFEGGATFAGG